MKPFDNVSSTEPSSLKFLLHLAHFSLYWTLGDVFCGFFYFFSIYILLHIRVWNMPRDFENISYLDYLFS
jgi:hypothetical protein